MLFGNVNFNEEKHVILENKVVYRIQTSSTNMFGILSKDEFCQQCVYDEMNEITEVINGELPCKIFLDLETYTNDEELCEDTQIFDKFCIRLVQKIIEYVNNMYNYAFEYEGNYIATKASRMHENQIKLSRHIIVLPHLSFKNIGTIKTIITESL